MAKRLDKPIRLYVLAVFVVVGYGLLPLVSAFPFSGGGLLVGPIILPLNGSILALTGSYSETPVWVVAISLSLSLFAALASVLAAAGISEARWATLVLVTLDVLWWIFLVVLLVRSSENPAGAGIRASIEIIIPLFWLGFVWWNYTRPDITAYYRQIDETP